MEGSARCSEGWEGSSAEKRKLRQLQGVQLAELPLLILRWRILRFWSSAPSLTLRHRISMGHDAFQRAWKNAQCSVYMCCGPTFSWVSTVCSQKVLAGVGTLIEFWKITKVMNVSVETAPGKLPRLKIENRSSYVDSNTRKWDDEATRWMLALLVPCVIGYFIYSLMYQKHKNWCAAALVFHIKWTCTRPHESPGSSPLACV